MALVLRVETGLSPHAQTPAQVTLRHDATFVIGRGSKVDWNLPDPNKHVSAIHCLIESKNGDFILFDRSTNGTFLNGSNERLVDTHKLQPGDAIRIGPYLIQVNREASAHSLSHSVTPQLPQESQNTKDIVDSSTYGQRGNDPAAVALWNTQDIDQTEKASTHNSMTMIKPFIPADPKNEGAKLEIAKPEASAQSSRTLVSSQRQKSQANPMPSEAEGNDLLKRLEAQLGIPFDAKDFPEPLMAVEQLARIVKALVESTESASRVRREQMQEMGSRRDFMRKPNQRDVFAGRSVQTLQRLMNPASDPTQLIVESIDFQSQHDLRLLAAIRAGAERMAGIMAPPSEEIAGNAEDLRNWLIDYRSLWQGLGNDWNTKFAAAMLLHVVTSYDQGTDV
jgi:type VI secretion system FHA domain protein